MTVAAKTPEAAQATATSPMPNTEQAFNWRHCWYPVTFVQDLPKNRPYSFSLYDEPFVLFTNQDGKLSCLTDRCPHRAAKLSDGQIIDSKIECLYHGWQFDTDGQCLHIPQLPADAKIPVNACVFSRHTQFCSSCNRAYQVTNTLKQVSVGVACALAALAIVTDSFGMQIPAVSASLGAAALAAIAENAIKQWLLAPIQPKDERDWPRSCKNGVQCFDVFRGTLAKK